MSRFIIPLHNHCDSVENDWGLAGSEAQKHIRILLKQFGWKIPAVCSEMMVGAMEKST